MNRFTQPHYNRITTAAERRNPAKDKRKYLREPEPIESTGWILDTDVQHMYLGGVTMGNHYLWGTGGSGKSNISTLYFNKLSGQWQSHEPKKEFVSPFKKA